MKSVAALAVMGFLTLVLRWDLLSIYLQYLWWAAVVIVVALGLLVVRKRQWIETESRRALYLSALDPVIGLGLFGYAATGLFHPPAVDLRLPFESGRFFVGQGGNNVLVNYHNSYPPQRFAIDIVGLDGLGRRAAGVEPPEMTAYAIYGRPVVAPCAGTVVAAVDGIPDTPIGGANTEQVAGNHVILACAKADIVLAHLRAGTVVASVGDEVGPGQRLGEAGNSGNSTEPHLHIHATPPGTRGEGEGVAITFAGVFPVRGAILGD